jgi:hypothetical protein
MDAVALNRLRLVESEMVHLQTEIRRAQHRLYELHSIVVDMLNAELASPLNR